MYNINSPFFLIQPSRKTLVFHLGKEAGFYSEFNNMVLCILYCYKHEINFKLYSKDATFGYRDGWTDFFEPFCEEVTESLHSLYNIRQPINIPCSLFYKIKKNFYKRWYKFNFYTYDLWLNFHNRDFEKERFIIDNCDMNILEASKYIIDKIWRYNLKTQTKIDNLIRKAALPTAYVGLHIRRGDKIIEHPEEDLAQYMIKLGKYSNVTDVFVYTDDYDVICLLKEHYPNYTFYTLVDESDRGYFHHEFIKKGSEYKNKALLKMFASIDLLSRAEYCVGTFSTNPGMFLGMRMPKGRMIGVDYDTWRIW